MGWALQHEQQQQQQRQRTRRRAKLGAGLQFWPHKKKTLPQGLAWARLDLVMVGGGGGGHRQGHASQSARHRPLPFCSSGGASSVQRNPTALQQFIQLYAAPPHIIFRAGNIPLA